MYWYVGVVVYHNNFNTYRKRTAAQRELMPMIHYTADPPQIRDEITYSTVEVPRDESPPEIPDSDKISNNEFEDGQKETAPHDTECDNNQADIKDVCDRLPLMPPDHGMH